MTLNAGVPVLLNSMCADTVYPEANITTCFQCAFCIFYYLDYPPAWEFLFFAKTILFSLLVYRCLICVQLNHLF